jgi:hypothetical protein
MALEQVDTYMQRMQVDPYLTPQAKIKSGKLKELKP